MREFTSEDDLQTLDGWLKYQGINPATTTPDEWERWRLAFEAMMERTAVCPKFGQMKFRQVSGEHRYAVAIDEDSYLWLTLWVKRSRKGEFFVFQPRGDEDWNPHTSYHLDGTLHMKSYDRKVLTPQKRQPLTGTFRGSEDLGFFAGHGTRGIGAICDPTAFSGVVRVAPGVLGPRYGWVKVDLVEPGHEPVEISGSKIITRHVFCDITPFVVITVGSWYCG